jgi:hypothetical protein
MADFEVRPPVSAGERVALEHALKEIATEAVAADPRASSAWWRAGVLDGPDAADPFEAEPSGSERYAPSPRSTRGATRA